MTVLIKNGHVVDPLTKKDGVYDVLVEGKKIQKIAEKIDEKADRVIDVRGTFVLPGFIDLHVHLRDRDWNTRKHWRQAEKRRYTVV